VQTLLDLQQADQSTIFFRWSNNDQEQVIAFAEEVGKQVAQRQWHSMKLLLDERDDDCSLR